MRSVSVLPRCLAARAMLQRAYVGGAGREELGKQFGLVANEVKTALRRLRAGLRECVARRLGGET